MPTVRTLLSPSTAGMEDTEQLLLQLSEERQKNSNLFAELTALRKRTESLVRETEAEEEALTLRLSRKCQNLTKEKEQIVRGFEEEEEAVTNRLHKKMEEMRREKAELQRSLEFETEYVANKLQAQLLAASRQKDTLQKQLEHEKAALASAQYAVEQLQAEVSSMRSPHPQPSSTHGPTTHGHAGEREREGAAHTRHHDTSATPRHRAHSPASSTHAFTVSRYTETMPEACDQSDAGGACCQVSGVVKGVGGRKGAPEPKPSGPVIVALEAEAEATTLRLLRQVSAAQSKARFVHSGWSTGIRAWIQEQEQDASEASPAAASSAATHALLQRLRALVDELDVRVGAVADEPVPPPRPTPTPTIPAQPQTKDACASVSASGSSGGAPGRSEHSHGGLARQQEGVVTTPTPRKALSYGPSLHGLPATLPSLARALAFAREATMPSIPLTGGSFSTFSPGIVKHSASTPDVDVSSLGTLTLTSAGIAGQEKDGMSMRRLSSTSEGVGCMSTVSGSAADTLEETLSLASGASARGAAGLGTSAHR